MKWRLSSKSQKLLRGNKIEKPAYKLGIRRVFATICCCGCSGIAAESLCRWRLQLPKGCQGQRLDCCCGYRWHGRWGCRWIGQDSRCPGRKSRDGRLLFQIRFVALTGSGRWCRKAMYMTSGTRCMVTPVSEISALSQQVETSQQVELVEA